MDAATVHEPVSIRPYATGDLASIYSVCLRTGDAGDDASDLYDDPQLLGHVYAGPYLAYEPDLAFVAEHATGVTGYVLGARDVSALADRLERDWWPALRRRYPIDDISNPHDRLLVERIHHPVPPPPIAAEHPSELHVDLLPAAQGTGAGRRLIETLLAALRDTGSPGVHFGVDPRNSQARGFYRHLGFDERQYDGSVVFTMSL
jgi:GNAT superfamily N-acetyltransferase